MGLITIFDYQDLFTKILAHSELELILMSNLPGPARNTLDAKLSITCFNTLFYFAGTCIAKFG
jgi:hypothetical protein